MTKYLQEKIQKVQNNCLRFIFGLRKFDHVSSVRKTNKMLNMQDRRLLHALSMMFRIKNGTAPSYLCDRITRQSDIHSHNTRNRDNITTPFARTNMRAHSFFVHTSKKFNHVSKNIKVTGVSLLSFKSNCRKYLLEQDQPWKISIMISSFSQTKLLFFCFSSEMKQISLSVFTYILSVRPVLLF